MKFSVAVKRSVLLGAVLAACAAPTAGAAIVDLGAPNTMSQFWNAPVKDMAIAPANTADAVPDLHTSRYFNFSSTVQVRSSNTYGEYRQLALPGYILSVQDITVGSEPFGIDVADSTGDGNVDIVTAYTNGVAISRGTSIGSYTSFTAPSGNLSAINTDVKLARIDGNSQPDLVAARQGGFDVFYNTGDPTTPFAARNAYLSYTLGNGLAVGDFDGDGVNDAATTTLGDQRVLVALEQGVTPLSDGRSIGLFTRPGAIISADVAGDSRPELIVTEPDRGTVAIISTASLPTSLGPITRIETGYSPVDVETADLDGNGVLEIITANAGSNSVTIGEVGGASKSFPAGPSPHALSIGNMNADGSPDIIVANDGIYAVSTLANLGLPAAPAQPAPPLAPIVRKASLKCSTKTSKKKVREVSCTATLTKKADAKALSAVLSLGKKKVKTVKASVGKKLAFKFPKGLKAGKYSVTMTVTNKDGTKLSASKTVKVK